MKTEERKPAIQAQTISRARIVVVKIGSAVLTQPGSTELDLPVMEALCAEMAALVAGGRSIILVTSGAVAAGRAALKVTERKPVMAVKQALAAVGQSRLMHIYAELFARHNIICGQMLLSLGDMEDRRRYVNARYTLEELLNRGCIPIINENDTVTVDELRFGDNDGLAAMVAVKMQADALILLSDVDGLYDSNPKTNPDAKLLERVDDVTAEMLDCCSDAAARGMIQVGTGGMTTKLQAARLATQNGVCTAIAQGKRAGILGEVLEGTFHGTFFPAGPCQRSRRERWLLAGKTCGRQITVDEGAGKALLTGKKSLLPAGIRDIHGDFKAHDLVEILGPDGSMIARGIVNYSSAELAHIKGRRTADIESLLGARPYNEAIHRDNLALVNDPHAG